MLKDIKVAKGFSDNLFGMLLTRNSNGLKFETRFGIHTFFMKNPIDVLIIDEKKKVAKIKKNLVPNRIYIWMPIYKKVIELPTGSVDKLKIKVGDKLDF